MLTKKLFIFNFLKKRNIKEAAINAGFSQNNAFFEGINLLSKKSVANKIKKLSEKLSNDPYLVNAGLERLAFGSINDAVSLVFAKEFPSEEKLQSLDLFNISEIKRDKNGGVEIKFFDRLKALEKLWEVQNTAGVNSSAESFLKALCNYTDNTQSQEENIHNNDI